MTCEVGSTVLTWATLQTSRDEGYTCDLRNASNEIFLAGGAILILSLLIPIELSFQGRKITFGICNSYLSPNENIAPVLSQAFSTCGFLMLTIWSGLSLSCDLVLVLLIGAVAVVSFAQFICAVIYFDTRGLKGSLRNLYKSMLQPIGVPKHVARKLFNSGSLINMRKGEKLFQENADEATFVSILLKGRCILTFRDHPIAEINRMEFVDSPEYICNYDTTYKMTTHVIEDSLFVVFNRCDLDKMYANSPYIKTIVENLIGLDILRKLHKISQTVQKSDIDIELSPLINWAYLWPSLDPNIRERLLECRPINLPGFPSQAHTQANTKRPTQDPYQHQEPLENMPQGYGDSLVSPPEVMSPEVLNPGQETYGDAQQGEWQEGYPDSSLLNNDDAYMTAGSTYVGDDYQPQQQQ